MAAHRGSGNNRETFASAARRDSLIEGGFAVETGEDHHLLRTKYEIYRVMLQFLTLTRPLAER
jgi:hypothetical protein